MRTSDDYREKLLEGLMSETDMRFQVTDASGADAQRMLIRAYMNVREPTPATDDLLRIQDLYLSARRSERGVVDSKAILTIDRSLKSERPFSDKICLWRGDITTLDCDAIVNAANSQMLGCFQPCHACIDNCIHTYAGMQLRMECDHRMQELRKRFGDGYQQPTAIPMLTDAYNLPCRKVIHVVGPIVHDKLTPDLERSLGDCYRNILDTCRESGIRSVALCCISTGVFHFPNQRAAEIAVSAVDKWLACNNDSVDKVIFNVFIEKDWSIYKGLLS